MKQAVEQIRLKAGRISSSHAFVSMFIWKEEMQLTIWLEPDGYMMRQGCRGEQHYFFPCGTDAAKKKMLSMLSVGAVLHYADAQDLAFLEQWKPGRYQAQSARGDWEYLYHRQAQLDLRGTYYGKIRRRVNCMRALPGWRTQPIDAQSLPTVNTLEALWQTCNHDRIGVGDSRAVDTALKSFQALDLTGLILFVEDTPVGFFFGAFLDDKTFCGLAPRTMKPAYFPGLRWELYNALSPDVLTINLEEDMNLEGLRQNKTEQHPDGFHEMWDIMCSAPEEETT